MSTASRRPRRVIAAALATLTLVGTVATGAAASDRSTGVIEYFADVDINNWTVHGLQVTTPGAINITVSWDDPATNLNVFLRAPGSTKAVASATAPSSPLVLTYDATQTGTWTLAVKVVAGSSPYRIDVEVEGPDAPVAQLPSVRQPYDTPAATWQAVGRVRAIVPTEDVVWLGGHFQSIIPAGAQANSPDALTRERFAAIDARTGQPLPIAPVFDKPVWAMALSPDGSVLYLGGEFRTVNGVTRNRLAAIDTATGDLLPWNPGASSIVRTMLMMPDGARVIVGGQFKSTGGKPQAYVAAIRTTTGKSDPAFHPVIGQQDAPCPPRCSVVIDSLALSQQGDLYIGGHFGILNGQNRNNGGAVSFADTSVALPWAPDVFTPDPNNPNQKNLIANIAVPPASSPYTDRVVICGDWYRVAGVPSPNVEAVDAITGVPIPGWTASTDGGTPGCAADNRTVYIGGHFTRAGGTIAKVDGQDRAHLAAFDLGTGALLSWNPGTDSVLGVHRLVIGPHRLFIGGDFFRTAGARQRSFATFWLRPVPAAPQP